MRPAHPPEGKRIANWAWRGGGRGGTRYRDGGGGQAGAGAIAVMLLLEDYQEDQEGVPSQVNLEAQETVLLFLRPKAMMVVLGVVQNQIEYLEAVGALTSRVIPMVLVTGEMERHHQSLVRL